MQSIPKKFVFLFPPSKNRLDSIDNVLKGMSCPERYLFYGLDYYKKYGMPLVHNLMPVSSGIIKAFIAWFHKKLCSKIFIFYGEIEWIFPTLIYLYNSPLIFVFSERIMLPICYWRIAHLLPKRPTVFIPMGLPEKLNILRDNRLTIYQILINSLKTIDQIICVNKLEEQILNSEHGLENTSFVRVGVDTDYFKPLDIEEDVDVLCIGADKFRDFQLFFTAAKALPHVSFRVITSRIIAASFSDLPENVKLMTDVPMRQIREEIAKGRIIALPVLPNTFSGATTVVLQAMSMGKAVIANKVGSNVYGYPFVSGQNLLYVKSQDREELVETISYLLKDNGLRFAIGKAARETVIRELGLTHFHHELLGIINKVAQPDN